MGTIGRCSGTTARATGATSAPTPSPWIERPRNTVAGGPSMCGIVGYIGPDQAVSVLTPALKRLEYRGYDSAGVATINGHGLEIRRAVGKIANLETAVAAHRPEGRVGIAHTRWATHGRPSEANAHPQTDCARRVAVVHNGIIENHRQLRQQLVAEGHRFSSETDTEVFAHLVERYLDLGLPKAVQQA